MIPTVQAFDSAFITTYNDAFTELVSLGQVIGENMVNGKQAKYQRSIGRRLLTILEALDNPELTTKQVEALELCLTQLTESLFGPTNTLNGGILDSDFLVYLGGSQQGESGDVSEFEVGSEDDEGSEIGVEHYEGDGIGEENIY